jgi:putative sigma-54 modulation protein
MDAMITNESRPAPATADPRLLFRGIHLSLTPAMRAALSTKAARLLRHEPRIDRIRIDLDHDLTRGRDVFVAKGHIEIGGPDLIASVAAEDAYKAADLLMDKLDRLLARRDALAGKRRHRRDKVAAGGV